jgi:hypothetical protein
LGLVFPFAAVGQGTSNGIKLPSIYQDKLDDFLINNNVMKNNNAKNFTINFVEKEMEADWQISKENQLLFIWHTIYKELTNQDLYDGKDGNQQIAEDFGNKSVSTKIRICRQKYRNGYTAYMNQSIAEAQQRSAEAKQVSAEAQQRSAEAQQRSAEAQQRSAEAQQRSAEAQQRSAEAQQRSAEAQQRSAEAIKDIMQQDTLGLKEMSEFYTIYTRNPNNVKKEEIERSKELLKWVIPDCKKYGIDYRAILLKETGDVKKVDAILKFYEIAD